VEVTGSNPVPRTESNLGQPKQLRLPRDGRGCGLSDRTTGNFPGNPRNGCMSRSPRVPSYRRHSSGQARVTIDGKDILLGPYCSEESKEAYRRTVAEWAERKGQFAPKAEASSLSVNEVLLAYYKHAVAYYGYDKDPNRGDAARLRDALR